MAQTTRQRRRINPHDATYHKLIMLIQKQGVVKKNRTGIPTTDIFGTQMRFNLRRGFPLFTTKKVFFRGIKEELLWFIRGDTNVKSLIDVDVHIWNEWAFRYWLQNTDQTVPAQDSPQWIEKMAEFVHKIKTEPAFAAEWGDLGRVYGYQWNFWPDSNGGFINQLDNVVSAIKENPNDRRIIVSSWNPTDIPKMKLPPCHHTFQFDVTKGVLSCMLTQRSCDMFLGVPFNVASYSLLVHMIAQVTGTTPGDFIWNGGSTHLYTNHTEQIALQLSRDSRKPPRLVLDPSITNLRDFRSEHIQVEGYDPHPTIKAPVAV